MKAFGKVAIVPGMVGALLVGVVVGGCSREPSEQEKYYKKLNEQEAVREQEERQSFDRMDALSAAKAVVIAALTRMSETNADVLPGPDMFKAFVQPKLAAEDAGALDNFVWTFPGGNLNDLESPATTEIGHIPYPGGRAVAYADGSARKIPEG